MKTAFIISTMVFMTWAQRPSPTDSRPIILAFGDSLTAGYGLPRGFGYPEQLQRKLDQRGPRPDQSRPRSDAIHRDSRAWSKRRPARITFETDAGKPGRNDHGIPKERRHRRSRRHDASTELRRGVCTLLRRRVP